MKNKGKIIDAAIRLFYLLGYDGTSIDTLIKEAGVSKSNFYYYFESKEELGLKIVEILVNRSLSSLSETLNNRTDLNPVERFVECYNNILSEQRDHIAQSGCGGSFFGNLALEQSAINEKFRSALDEYFQKCEEIVEGCLREGLEQGFFYDTLDPEAMAKLLVSQFEGAMIRVKTQNSLAALEEVYYERAKLMVKDEWFHMTKLKK